MSDQQSPAYSASLDISDADVLKAMEAIPGYLDITPGDFKELYRLVYKQTLDKITQAVTAKSLMSSPVITVTEDTPLRDAASIMAEHRVSGVPVLNAEQQVVGVVSEKNFLEHMGESTARSFFGVIANWLATGNSNALPLHAKTVQEIMTSPAITVSPAIHLPEIMQLFKSKKINRVPVVDQHGALAGIVTREDIVHTQLVQL